MAEAKEKGAGEGEDDVLPELKENWTLGLWPEGENNDDVAGVVEDDVKDVLVADDPKSGFGVISAFISLFSFEGSVLALAFPFSTPFNCM